MKIQIVNYSGYDERINGDEIEINKFHDAKSFDDFDINVVFLNDEKMWRYTEQSSTNTELIDSYLDLKSLGVSIKNSSNSIVIIEK